MDQSWIDYTQIYYINWNILPNSSHKIQGLYDDVFSSKLFSKHRNRHLNSYMKFYLSLLAFITSLSLFASELNWKEPEHSFAQNALEITFPDDVCGLELFQAWNLRHQAELYLEKQGYTNHLCYWKMDTNSWQLVPFNEPAPYLDIPILRTLDRFFKQAKVVYHSTFSPVTDATSDFWSEFKPQGISQESSKYSGQGPLIDPVIVERQCVYSGKYINMLYNYAPLKTGGEEIHFLLVPKKEQPARNFLELSSNQYLELVEIAKQVQNWASEQGALSYFFDKTGVLAGQTQPLYHAHLIVLKADQEEFWGRLNLLLRMIWPPSALNDAELARRVKYYQNLMRRKVKPCTITENKTTT